MKTSCNICGGTGVIEKENRFFECQCSYIKRLSAFMPVYLKKAEIKKEHLELPIFKHINKHALVIASWADMKAIIKSVMIGNPKKFIRITSDREIRDVYVGSKSRAARGDEDGKIYNSLEDLMDIADLVVCRMNELSYKNKAASGAVEEAISYRVDRDKPTWIFSDIEKPFTQGSHAYSDSIADIIKTHMPIFRIPLIITQQKLDLESLSPIGIVKKTQEDTEERTDSISETKINVQSEKPKKTPSSLKIRPSEDVDAGLARYGSGIKPSVTNKFSRK